MAPAAMHAASDLTPPLCLSQVARALLQWYARHRRDLPWRTAPDAYGIWVSEIMLQQTRMETAVPRWHAFLQRFPTLASLAAASEHEVCEAWAGLGYYSRARNLSRAAKVVVQLHGGQLPRAAAALRDLPGIGPYTAGAIASTAFGEAVPLVDGNVARVLSRLLVLTDPANTPPGQAAFWRHAAALLAASAPHGSPGDFNQALMELGALVCLPRAPRCMLCPWQQACGAKARGLQATLPVKVPKKAPVALEMAYALHVNARGLLLVRRPLQGLWAGLWEPPSAAGPDGLAALRARGFALGPLLGQVDHVLTHRLVRARVYACGPGAPPRAAAGQLQRRTRNPATQPLSGLARKVVALLPAASLSNAGSAGTSQQHAPLV